MNALNWAIRQSSWRHEKLSGHKPRKLRDWSKPLYDAELKMFKCSFLNCNVSSKRKLNLKRYMTNRKSNLKRHLTKHHEENFQALIMKKKQEWYQKSGYSKVRNHLQPSTTTQHNPQPLTTICNHPQPPKPPTTIHNHPRFSETTYSDPQSSTTTYNHPKIHPQTPPKPPIITQNYPQPPKSYRKKPKLVRNSYVPSL